MVLMINILVIHIFFFFNDTATTEIYTLSLHDALPIFERLDEGLPGHLAVAGGEHDHRQRAERRRLGRRAPAYDHDDHGDRKSTRLNSSHLVISYAVFCLKKKYKPTVLHTIQLYIHITC